MTRDQLVILIVGSLYPHVKLSSSNGNLERFKELALTQALEIVEYAERKGLVVG